MNYEKENWNAPGCTGYKKPRDISNLVGKRLSDARIAFYQKRGWYDAEQHQARLKRATSRPKRVGNWVEAGDGRMIYCP